jgi:hypothetical protein
MSPSRSALAIHNVALGLGLCASSFLFWGNVALAEMGVMHMVKARHRERLGIRPAQALQLWETFFDRGLYVCARLSIRSCMLTVPPQLQLLTIRYRSIRRVPRSCVLRRSLGGGRPHPPLHCFRVQHLHCAVHRHIQYAHPRSTAPTCSSWCCSRPNQRPPQGHPPLGRISLEARPVCP